jgi:nitrogen-specific signal transduction histidine kinase/CheY-like chemotaxis protein
LNDAVDCRDRGFLVESPTDPLMDPEERLHQASKMEALGRLAGGVAHDFNNLLAAMRGYTELVSASLAPSDPRRADLEQVLRATDRAKEMTTRLLAFGRRQDLAPRVIDPATTVEELAPLLRRLLGEDVDLLVVTPDDVGRVAADPCQLEQAIINLAANARDAMPAGGTLTVELFNADLGPEVAAAHPELPPGRYVALAVSDTGIGMDPSTLSHAFEPFYTTKAPGAGTGLGLASVYGFVKQSGGFVYVGSDPGRGTDFTVYLPRVWTPAELVPVMDRSTTLPRGSETVLVVEDDWAVGELVRRVLDSLGYRVLVTSTGAEALAVASETSEPFDLLITDVGVPDMRGPVLAQRLKSLGRVGRVMLVSGYTEPTLIERGDLIPEAAFLAKPFSGADLARKVRETLSGGL